MFAIIIPMLLGRQRRYKMVYYDLRIEKQRIYGADKIAIAADANETVSFRFHFDANWRIFDSKAAIFRTAENKFYIIEIKHSAVTVPWEVLTVDRNFELSVIGYDGSKVLTAGKEEVRVVSSLLPEDCKTFSPSETLFDRFRQDSIDEAYKKYRNEIETLKRSYEEKILEIGSQLNKANQNTEDMEKAKNEEIAELNQVHSAEIHSLNSELADVKNELAQTEIRADKWDLVEAAMSDKTRSNYAPWCGGTKPYKLPFFNTKNLSVLTAGNFDDYCTEIGLDLSSVTTFEMVFKGKSRLRRLELRNTGNITSLMSGFSFSTALREVLLGDLTSCTNLKWAFDGDTSLEKVTFGKHSKVVEFSYLFNGCIALKEIDAELDFTVARQATDTFAKCASLEKVSFKKDSIGVNLDLGSCQALSKESMLNLFDGLAVKDSMRVTVSRYAFENNFPTSEEQETVRSSITQKGWTLSLA